MPRLTAPGVFLIAAGVLFALADRFGGTLELLGAICLVAAGVLLGQQQRVPTT